MDSIIIFGAQYLYLIILVLAPVFYWFGLDASNRKTMVIRLVVAAILAYGFAKLGSMLWYDPRPFVSDGITPLIAHANDNGFPSDHTLLASLVGFVTLASLRWAGALLLFLAVLVGASRVAVGVHHPIDVIGSFAFSGLAVLIVVLVERQFKKSNKHEPTNLPKSPKS